MDTAVMIKTLNNGVKLTKKNYEFSFMPFGILKTFTHHKTTAQLFSTAVQSKVQSNLRLSIDFVISRSWQGIAQTWRFDLVHMRSG